MQQLFNRKPGVSVVDYLNKLTEVLESNGLVDCYQEQYRDPPVFEAIFDCGHCGGIVAKFANENTDYRILGHRDAYLEGNVEIHYIGFSPIQKIGVKKEISQLFDEPLKT